MKVIGMKRMEVGAKLVFEQCQEPNHEPSSIMFISAYARG